MQAKYLTQNGNNLSEPSKGNLAQTKARNPNAGKIKKLRQRRNLAVTLLPHPSCLLPSSRVAASCKARQGPGFHNKQHRYLFWAYHRSLRPPPRPTVRQKSGRDFFDGVFRAKFAQGGDNSSSQIFIRNIIKQSYQRQNSGRVTDLSQS